MSEDSSNNRSHQNQNMLSDEDNTTLQRNTSETDTEYVSVQEQFDLEHPLLLHWKKLCEENYRDIQKELELKREDEIRIAELEKIDSIVYPAYTSRMRELQKARHEVEELARKYPHCIKREGTVYVALSRKDCLQILEDISQKQSKIETEASSLDISIQDMLTKNRRCFGGNFEKDFYSRFGKPSLSKFFRRIGHSDKDLTPDLVAMKNGRNSNVVAKVLIRGRCFIYKGRPIVQLLRRINEASDLEITDHEERRSVSRPMSALSMINKSRVQTPDRENILRKTYIITESGLVCKPEGDSSHYSTNKNEDSVAKDDMNEKQTDHLSQGRFLRTKDSNRLQNGPIRSDSPSVSAGTFPRLAPLPRILSTQSQKSYDANSCMVEGHAIKRRPLSGPEITSPRYSTLPLKATRELPPLLKSRVGKATNQKTTGFDLETKEKKFMKNHGNYKKTRPNSPVKRSRVNNTSQPLIISGHRRVEKDHESKRERTIPLPPIKDKVKGKKTH